ncbi:ABC transporter permease subunit [Myxococcota bacterium]|nr:ABC transporter permease subunit [Myxococcota bacterium]
MSPRTKGRIGVALLVLLALLSAGHPLLADAPFAPTCPFGQDIQFPYETVCSRTIGGLWRSILVGVSAGAAACGLALALALVGRRLGALADQVVAKSADVVFAIPDVLILIGIAFAVNVLVDQDVMKRPPALLVMIVSLTSVGWAAPTRMIQNRLRTLERQEFVTAAVAIGASRWRVLLRHLLPFAQEYILAIFLLRVPAIILAESTVSFLGFLASTEASLGQYLGQNYAKLMQGHWQVVGPAWALLVLVVLAFQWTGQGLLARTGVTGRS